MFILICRFPSFYCHHSPLIHYGVKFGRFKAFTFWSHLNWMFHLSLASYKTTFCFTLFLPSQRILHNMVLLYYILYRDHRYFIECFIEIYYSIQFMVFYNGKWSEVMDSRQSPALFLCPQKLMVAFVQTFLCSLDELSVIKGLQELHLTECGK